MRSFPLSFGVHLLVRGDRRNWIRVFLTAAGVAIGVWCLLVALALPSVLKARQARAAGRTPVGASAATAVGRIGIVEDRFGVDTISTVYVQATSPTAPLPPGVREYPAEGRAVVSPALAAALRADARVRSFFPFLVSGTITDEGLVGPAELYAYVGGGDKAPYAGPFSSFGKQFSEPVDVRPEDLSFVQRAFVGLLGIPLAAFFAVTARLSAASRDRRLAALRLVGMSASDARRVSVVEPVVAALVGTVLGCVVFALSHGFLARVGIGGLEWFTRDSVPSATRLIAVLVMVPWFAAAMGVLGSQQAIRNALAVRRQGGVPKSPARVRLLPLALALTVLGGLIVTGSNRPAGLQLDLTGVILLFGSVLLGGVGLAVGLAPLIAITSRWLVGHVRAPGSVLAFRRLEFDPSSPARVVVGIVLVIFASGFAAGLQRDAVAATGSIGQVERYTLDAYQVPREARQKITAMRDVTANTIVVASVVEPRPGVPSQQNLPIVIMFASCADAERLAETHLDCREGNGYRISSQSSQLRHRELRPRESLRIPLDRSPKPRFGHVQVPEGVMQASDGNLIGFRIDLLLPPDQLPEGSVPDSAQFWLGSPKSTEAIESITSQVATLAPDAVLQFPEDDYKLRRQLGIYRGMMRAGLLLGVIVAVAAFVVAAIDRAVERRANVVALGIVGVPRRTLRLAQALQVAYPLAVGGIVASVSAFLLEQATVIGGGMDRSFEWQTLLAGLVVTALASLVAGAVSSLAVQSTLDVSLIRRE